MASGTITGTTGNRYITVKIDWTSVADEQNNQSSIKAELYARKSSASSDATTASGTWYIVIDGQSTVINKRVDLNPDNTWFYMGKAEKVVNHNEDGTKSCVISVSGKITSANLSWDKTNLQGTAVLDSIPRQTKPILDADEKEFGETVQITLNRAEDSFHHAISYIWNGVEHTISDYVEAETSSDYEFYSDIETETYRSIVSFALPMDCIYDIPNAASGEMVFKVTTYRSDDSMVGVSLGTLTCNVPASCKPIITSIVLSDSGTRLPSEWGIFVKGMSVLHVKVNAEGQYGASISNYAITALDQTKIGNDIDIADINQSGSVSVSVTVTDSRGMSRTDSTAATVTVYDYVPPAIELFQVTRCNEYGTPTDNGTCARVTIQCSISSLNNHNSMEVRIHQRSSVASSWTQALLITPSGTSLSSTYVIKNIDPAYTYDIKIEVQDATATSSQEGMVAAEGAIISWRDGGIGIAFGKTAEEDDTAEFGWKIHARKEVSFDVPLGQESGGTGNADGTIDIAKVTYGAESAAAFVNNIKGQLMDVIYPIGSLYITVNSTSPAAFLGGSWEQIKDRFLLAAGDNYSAGAEGGAENYTLTVENHQHSIMGYSQYTANVGSSANGHLLTQTTAGGGFTQTIDTMPPYLAVYVWKRIA